MKAHFLAVIALLCYLSSSGQFSNQFLLSDPNNLQEINDIDIDEDANGNFVVVWDQEFGGAFSEDNGSIFFRRYNSNGVSLDTEQEAGVGIGYPRVDMRASGSFVIVWSDNNEDAIECSVYNRFGDPVNEDFVVAGPFGNFDFIQPDVAMDANGNFVVVWEESNFLAGDYSIRGQRYNASGTKLGSSFVVSPNNGNFKGDPKVEREENGNFIVIWEDVTQNIIYGQKYSTNGTKLNAEFSISNASPVAVETLANGEFIVQGTRSGSSFIQFFDSSSNKVGGEIAVEEGPIDVEPNGNFINGWVENDFVYAQRYAPDASKIGSPVIISNSNPDYTSPAFSLSSTCDFRGVWIEADATLGPFFGVRGRTFSADNSLPTTCYEDLDNDGFGSMGSTIFLCGACEGDYAANQNDCNDDPNSNGASVSPANDEILGDGIDNNCNSKVDESPFSVVKKESACINCTEEISNSSVALDIQGTNKGVLFPRLVGTNAITNPENGLIIYDSTAKYLRFHDGNNWNDIRPSIWETNDVENIFSPTNTFVGVGTDNPTARLHVASLDETAVFESGNTDNYIGIGNTINGEFRRKGYFGMFSGDEDIDIGTGYGNTAGKVHLVTASTPKVTLLNNGNLGIGTQNPSNRLDVNGDIALTDNTGRIEFREDGIVKSFINWNGSTLEIENNETSEGDINLDASDDINIDAVDDVFIDAANDVFVEAVDDIFFRAGSTNATRMLIDQGGRTYIGTTSPISAQLHVQSSEFLFGVRGNNSVTGTGSGYGIYGLANGSGSGTRYGVYGFASTASTGNLYGVYGSTSVGTGQWAGYFSGDFYHTGSFTSTSDARLKKNVKPIDGMLEKVMQLQPKSYKFKTEEYDYINLAQGKQIGFLAQEVEDIFPELVEDAPHTFLIHDDKGEKGNALREEKKLQIKSLSYIGFIPVLTAAIQEQQTQIEAKDKRIEVLEEKVEELESLKTEMAALKNRMQQLLNKDRVQFMPDGNTSSEDVPSLQQNTPNPFNGITSITYYIPKNVNQAFIQITDANGKILERFEVAENGHGTLEIDATRMQTGQYFYSLILDGKVFESKQMLLAK